MDMSEMEAARQRMDDRVRGSWPSRVPSQHQNHGLKHHLRRATRHLHITPPVD